VKIGTNAFVLDLSIDIDWHFVGFLASMPTNLRCMPDLSTRNVLEILRNFDS
jgi:hypothetical protein